MLNNNLLGVHLARTRIATSQSAYNRVDDMIAVALKFNKIVLQDRVLPHTCIHGWRDKLWSACGQHGGGEHIVADAVSKFADNISCTGSHNKQVATLGQRHMFYIERKVAVEGINDALIVGKCLERHRSDELSGVLRHYHMHIGMQLNEHRGQIGALVGSNTARNAQHNRFSCQHNFFTFSPSHLLTVPSAVRASRSWPCAPACCARLRRVL